MSNLILNRIQTPDGTILTSHHVHDYVTYLDANGLEYMVDGGNDYLRRNVHENAPYKEMSVYDDAPFEIIRKSLHRGGRGKDGKQPLKWVALCDMSDSWIRAVMQYDIDHTINSPYTKWYEAELEYREEHAIAIPD